MIKGIKRTETGVEVSFTDLPKEALTDIEITSDSSIEKGGHDVYLYKYIDLSMKNPKRVKVMVVKKGAKVEKDWWNYPPDITEPKEVIRG